MYTVHKNNGHQFFYINIFCSPFVEVYWTTIVKQRSIKPPSLGHK